MHGNTPEEVLQDAEGLQMMRTLGENMAWLLRSIEAGKKAGVPAPQYDPRLPQTLSGEVSRMRPIDPYSYHWRRHGQLL